MVVLRHRNNIPGRLRDTIHGDTSSTPTPPDGFAFVIDENGAYLVDENGLNLIAEI